MQAIASFASDLDGESLKLSGALGTVDTIDFSRLVLKRCERLSLEHMPGSGMIDGMSHLKELDVTIRQDFELGSLQELRDLTLLSISYGHFGPTWSALGDLVKLKSSVFLVSTVCWSH